MTQLRNVGVTPEMVATRLRAGSLLRLRRGVFLAAAAWPEDPSARHLALARAELVANPAAVLSHQSAAVAWGLPSPGFDRWCEQPVSVTLPAGAGHGSQSRAGVHHVAGLPAEQVTRDPAGWPVTSLARTAIDLVRGRPLPEALVILDAAARKLCEGFVASPRRSDYSNPQLVRAARDQLLGASSRPAPAISEAIAATESARESAAESLSAGHFRLAGLPTPVFQARIDTPSGVFFPDCYWPEHNLVGECDGAVKYKDGEAYVQEKWREQVLRDLEFRMVRWLAREIMSEPWVVVKRVARALGF